MEEIYVSFDGSDHVEAAFSRWLDDGEGGQVEQPHEGMQLVKFDGDWGNVHFMKLAADGETLELDADYKAEVEAEWEAAAEQRRVEAQAQAARTAQLAVAAQLAVMSLDLTDEQAMEVSTLYPDWEVGGSYETGDIRRYGGALWRALQDSTGEAQYPPDAYTAGWKRIGEPDESGVFPWVQPLGATDAYAKGDVVTHGGKTWTSDIDANVWEPGVYGWTERGGGSGDDPEEPEGAPEWVQPTGAHDAYGIGDEVTYNGHLWRSTADGNVWAPGTVGAPWEDLGAVE